MDDMEAELLLDTAARPDPGALPWPKTELRFIDADGRTPLRAKKWAAIEPKIVDIIEDLADQHLDHMTCKGRGLLGDTK